MHCFQIEHRVLNLPPQLHIKLFVISGLRDSSVQAALAPSNFPPSAKIMVFAVGRRIVFKGCETIKVIEEISCLVP